MADMYTQRFADNIRFAKSRTILTPSAGTLNLIRLPKNAFVKRVWLLVTVVGSSDTVSIGWIGNGEAAQAAGFLSNDIAKVSVLGMKESIKDTLVSNASKYFNSASGSLTMTIGTTQTTGSFIAFCEYSVIW
jgi:hypothetical protein